MFAKLWRGTTDSFGQHRFTNANGMGQLGGSQQSSELPEERQVDLQSNSNEKWKFEIDKLMHSQPNYDEKSESDT